MWWALTYYRRKYQRWERPEWHWNIHLLKKFCSTILQMLRSIWFIRCKFQELTQFSLRMERHLHFLRHRRFSSEIGSSMSSTNSKFELISPVSQRHRLSHWERRSWWTNREHHCKIFLFFWLWASGSYPTISRKTPAALRRLLAGYMARIPKRPNLRFVYVSLKVWSGRGSWTNE